MTNGVRTVTQTTTETVTFTYPGLPGQGDVIVNVEDSIMSVLAYFNNVAWQAQLPLVSAPIMVQIAQDMMAELLAEAENGSLDAADLALIRLLYPGFGEDSGADSGDSGVEDSGLLDSGLSDSGL